MTCSASIHSEPRRTRRQSGHVIESRSAFKVDSFLAEWLIPVRIRFERVRVFTASTHPQPPLTGIHAYLLAGVFALPVAET